MKISVIMPVYNCADYLEAAISSVFKGGVDDIEIIAVEDCSSDSSRDLLCRLAADEPRIKPIYNKTNMGVAAVRNTALELATGEFLAFCDSDDTLPEGSYRKMLNAIGDKDILIGGFADLSDGGMERITFLHSSERSSLFKALMSVSCLWTKLIRRDVIKQSSIRFDEDMSIGEDVVFLARLSTLPLSYTVLDEVIYNHLHHERAATASLTHIYTLNAFNQHLECRKRLIDICEKNGNTECRTYVYENFTAYLDRFITFISDAEQRERAFSEYREFMRGYDWENHEELFRCMYGVGYSDFQKLSADGYIQLRYDRLPRDAVADEFAAGRIGLRWVWKFFKNWLKFKLRKKNR